MISRKEEIYLQLTAVVTNLWTHFNGAHITQGAISFSKKWGFVVVRHVRARKYSSSYATNFRKNQDLRVRVLFYTLDIFHHEIILEQKRGTSDGSRTSRERRMKMKKKLDWGRDVRDATEY